MRLPPEQDGDADIKVDLPTSLYDEAIHDFDVNFDKVIRFLRETGRLDRTIVVLYSDHGWKHMTKVRVPLIVRFPKRQYAGTVSEAAQNIDIAPTILDYLKIKKPEWMTGVSLISVRKNGCDPILSVWPIRTYDQQLKFQHRAEAKAPFYTLGAVSLVSCGKYYKYDLERNRLFAERPKGIEISCSDCKPLGRHEALRYILNHLRQNGYDTAGLQ
jgi:hypothetical protein